MKTKLIAIQIIVCLIVIFKYDLKAQVTEFNELDTIVFDLSRIERADTLLEFPVYLKVSAPTDTVYSFDFSFRFDTMDLNFTKIIKLKTNFSIIYNIKDTNLLFSSYSFNSIESGTDLILLQLKLDTTKAALDVNSLSNFRTLINEFPVTTKIITTICPGQELVLNAEGDINDRFLWSTGDTTQSISVTTGGLYSAVIVHPDGDTSKSVVTEVHIGELTVVTIAVDGPTTFCDGDSVQLNGITDSETSYLWSNGSIEPFIIVNNKGDYSVTVTNVFGCSNVSDTVSVIVNPLPDASLTSNGPLSFCEGDSVQLIANENEGYSYLWSSGDTTSSIWVSDAGNYQVTVTNVFGCSDVSAVVSAEVLPLPDNSVFVNGPTTFCIGDSVTISAVDDPGYFYLWSTGASTSSIQVYTSGTYFVDVTGANGCSLLSDQINVITGYLAEDIDFSGIVGPGDLGQLLNIYQQPCLCSADIDGSGVVGPNDLARLLNKYGQSCDD